MSRPRQVEVQVPRDDLASYTQTSRLHSEHIVGDTTLSDREQELITKSPEKSLLEVPPTLRKIAAAKRTSAPAERRLATPRADLFVIKVGDRYEREAIAPRETASSVLERLAKAMSKPKLDRKRIFQSVSGRPVYAYSIYLKDTSRLVREDAKGRRVVGRLVNGKFRASAEV